MNRLLVFATACTVFGMFLVLSSSAPGIVVSANETANLMGSVCYQESGIKYVCYGGNCMSGGCGCKMVANVISGGTVTKTTASNVTCRDGYSCVQSYDVVTTTSCYGE